jgi:hypothetical protein
MAGVGIDTYHGFPLWRRRCSNRRVSSLAYISPITAGFFHNTYIFGSEIPAKELNATNYFTLLRQIRQRGRKTMSHVHLFT